MRCWRILLVALLLLITPVQLVSLQTQNGAVELFATLRGHTKSIQQIEFSHSGQIIATTSEDGTVRLWSAVTGDSLATLPGAQNSDIHQLKWSNDDRRLAIIFRHRESSVLTVWDITGQKPVISKQYRGGGPSVPEVSHDKRLLVGANVNIYETGTGQLLTSILGGSTLISFSPDTKNVLTISFDDERKTKHRQTYFSIRKIEDGQELSAFQVPEGVREIFWSPNGKTLAIMGMEFSPRVIDVATGRENGRLPYGNCWPWTMFGSDGCEPIKFSADGTVLLKEKEPIKLWDAKTVSLIKILDRAHAPAVFSPTDGRLLATRSEDKKSVLLWRLTR